MLRTRVLGWLVIALVVGACGGASCLLSGFGPVTIETQMTGDNSSGTFTLSGGCDICTEGTVNNLDSGFDSEEEYFFVDELVCADGSGSS